MGASQMALVVKNSPANEGDSRDMDYIAGSERSPGGGHGNTLQYFCLENPMDREAWRAIVHRVLNSQTWLKWLSTHTCMTVSSSVIVTFVLPLLWNRHIHSFAHILTFLFFKLISESSLYILLAFYSSYGLQITIMWLAFLLSL